MSEVQKPVEAETVAPVEAAPVVAEPVHAPVAAESAPVAPVTESNGDVIEPAAATDAPAVEKVAEPAKFAGEGVLGYKAPGGNFLRKMMAQKRFFWFGEEPVESKNLASYLRGEKDSEAANHNAAWSSYTGKGLLYFSKSSGEKATPAGIINLADVSDVETDGTVDFIAHAHGAKHVFIASSSVERDNWVAAIKAKSAEAKEMVEEVKSHEKYKEHHSSLARPAVVAPIAAALAAPTATEATEETREEKKEEKEEKKDRKSRSVSRKRNSIFAGFGLGSKKEEAEAKEDKKVETAEAPVATTAEPVEPAPLDAQAVAAAVIAAPTAEETAKVEEAAPVATEAPRPVGSKRNSSFLGLFKGKKPSETKASEDTAPAVPAKDATVVEPVSAEAPVIPAPEATEPLAAAVASPATVPTTEEVVAAPETEEIKPEVKTETAQKRKSSLPWLSSKVKTPEAEGEKGNKTPFFSKIRQTVKGKTSPKAEKTAEKTEEAQATEPASEAPEVVAAKPAVEQPAIVSEPVTAVHVPTAPVSAAA